MRINLPDKLSLSWISRDGRLIMLSRGLRTFAQSAIAILIALYLEKLGFNLIQVGAFLSAGIAGAAFFAFIVSLISEKLGRKRLLIIFTLLPAATGLALVFFDDFLPLMFFAFNGEYLKSLLSSTYYLTVFSCVLFESRFTILVI